MGDIELQTFSERLKEFRISLGLTQAQFVEGLDITASALSSYEKNLKNPSISVAKRIAEKYNVSIDWLCGLTDKKENNEKLITYADMIRMIIQLCDIETGLNIWELEYEKEYYDFNEINVSKAYLKTIDNVITSFFKDWTQMYNLYKSGTIDKHLYKLWISDRIKQYEDINLYTEIPEYTNKEE